MNKPVSPFMTTREVAELLRVKERKVYELAASGEIPCTRALGKLLFQRAAVEAWLAAHGATSGQRETPVPQVLLGSHDPLLDWAIRESGSGLATYFDGSLDGLTRFAAGEGVAAGLHLFDPDGGDWNVKVVAERFAGQPVALCEFAWRERGLLVAEGNPRGIATIADLKGLRVAPRQPGSGTQVLFDHYLATAGVAGAIAPVHPTRTETDAALAVAEGKADAAFGIRSVAQQYRLGFVPVVRERYDILVWHRTWFQEPLQALFRFCRTDAFLKRVREIGGYDVSELGRVRHTGLG